MRARPYIRRSLKNRSPLPIKNPPACLLPLPLRCTGHWNASRTSDSQSVCRDRKASSRTSFFMNGLLRQHASYLFTRISPFPPPGRAQTPPELTTALPHSSQVTSIRNISKPGPVSVLHPAQERTLRINGAGPFFPVVVTAYAASIIQKGIKVAEARQLKAAGPTSVTMKTSCHSCPRNVGWPP